MKVKHISDPPPRRHIERLVAAQGWAKIKQYRVRATQEQNRLAHMKKRERHG